MAVGNLSVAMLSWRGNSVVHVVMVSTITYLVSIADRPEGSKCTG